MFAKTCFTNFVDDPTTSNAQKLGVLLCDVGETILALSTVPSSRRHNLIQKLYKFDKIAENLDDLWIDTGGEG